jgi:hypothetical protein
VNIHFDTFSNLHTKAVFKFVLPEDTQPRENWLISLILTDDVTCQMPQRVLHVGEGGTEEERKERDVKNGRAKQMENMAMITEAIREHSR